MVCEMLTNTAKHACASRVDIRATLEDETLHSASPMMESAAPTPSRGRDLVGLNDRVEALGGRLLIHSPAGGGTRAHCTIPIPRDPIDRPGRRVPREGTPDSHRDRDDSTTLTVPQVIRAVASVTACNT